MRSHIEVVESHAEELKEHAEDYEVVRYCALFHDVGIPYCKGRKIVESEIALELDPVKRAALQYDADLFRLEHMKVGGELVREILKVRGEPQWMIDKVAAIIEVHDMHKMYEAYPYTPDGMLFVECDVLWMLSPEGIARDIARAIENGLPPKTPQEQFKWNWGLIGYRIKHGRFIAARYKEMLYANSKQCP